MTAHVLTAREIQQLSLWKWSYLAQARFHVSPAEARRWAFARYLVHEGRLSEGVAR